MGRGQRNTPRDPRAGRPRQLPDAESRRPAPAPASAVPEAALPRGTALGRFVVLGLVGRGAMGEVYAAYDPDLDRKIAVKLLRSAGTGSAAGRRPLPGGRAAA